MSKQNLTKKSENFRKWYTEVIQQAKLADYSPVKGSIVFRPNGFGIWENIQNAFNPMLKKLGVKNAYFPLFIPMSLLQKEADHVEGFAPELAVVTHGGGEELEEKLAIRPTSETIMYDMYSKWVQSHRDLPMSMNQWNNVVRWEKRTYFFLRTTEFLWQEAHTAHKNHDESKKMVLDALSAYKKLVEEYLAIPVLSGKKSKSERFAGANETTCIEAMMPDGKALQAGTSHDLGQNFSKKDAFDISFQNNQGEQDYAWQTSYGLSTRILGALVMIHGDDKGLVLPPKISPLKIAIIPVFKDGKDDEILKFCQKIKKDLESKKSEFPGDINILDSQDKSFGWRASEAELLGYSLIIPIGPKEMENKSVSASYRITDLANEEIKIDENLSSKIEKMLEKLQSALLTKARRNLNTFTSDAKDYSEFKEVLKNKKGFVKTFWCEDQACEQQIKDETKATTRCLEFTDKEGSVKEESGSCVRCQKPSQHRWLFAQAY